MTNQIAQLNENLPIGRYLIKIQRNIANIVQSNLGEKVVNESDSIGEIEFMIEDSGASMASLQLARIGLISRGLALESENGSGRISVQRGSGSGEIVQFDPTKGELSISALAEMVYEALFPTEREGEPPTNDFEDIPGEDVSVDLKGAYTRSEIAVLENEVARFVSGNMTITSMSGEGKLIDTLTIPLANIPIFSLGPLVTSEGQAASPSEGNEENVPGVFAARATPLHRKTIKIQAVTFADSENDRNPTGQILLAQLAEANRLWGKGCIEFIQDGLPVKIVDGSLKVSSDFDKIMNSFVVKNNLGQKELNVIEVYFIDTDLTTVGGGYTRYGRTGLAKVFISELNGGGGNGNPLILAHELGHVLSLSHPNKPEAGYTPGSTNSITEPATLDISLNRLANPDLNTLENCLAGHNPAQETSNTLDCMSQL